LTGQTSNSEILALNHPDLETESLKEGDEVILDSNQRIILARLSKRKSGVIVEDDLVEIDWSKVGGQTKVIEEVRKVIEYPILHKDILETMEYQLPKGFLFYGPPGCGKTLIGRAILSEVIRELKEKESNQYLEGRGIHVKGPEILYAPIPQATC
jgi:proteasome-associated ATPase